MPAGGPALRADHLGGSPAPETFGDLETVAETKYELIEALPEDGVAFFPDDRGHLPPAL